MCPIQVLLFGTSWNFFFSEKFLSAVGSICRCRICGYRRSTILGNSSLQISPLKYSLFALCLPWYVFLGPQAHYPYYSQFTHKLLVLCFFLAHSIANHIAKQTLSSSHFFSTTSLTNQVSIYYVFCDKDFIWVVLVFVIDALNKCKIVFQDADLYYRNRT